MIPNTTNGRYAGNFDESDQSSRLLPASAVEFRTNNDFSRLLLTELAESFHPEPIMPTVSRSIRLTKSADGGVLLDVNQGVIFSLNIAGLRILELLQEGQTTASVVSRISSEFGAPEQLVLEDVEDFLRALGERGLLEGAKQAGYDSTI